MKIEPKVTVDVLFRLGGIPFRVHEDLGGGWWKCYFIRNEEDTRGRPLMWIPVHERLILERMKVIPILYRRQPKHVRSTLP
jgi:hypothetical protein